MSYRLQRFNNLFGAEIPIRHIVDSNPRGSVFQIAGCFVGLDEVQLFSCQHSVALPNTYAVDLVLVFVDCACLFNTDRERLHQIVQSGRQLF